MILLLSIEIGLHFMFYFIKIFFSAQFATLYISCSKHSMNMSFWVNFDKITILVFPMDLQNRPIYSKRNVKWSPNWDIFVLQIIHRGTAIFWNNKPLHFNLVKKINEFRIKIVFRSSWPSGREEVYSLMGYSVFSSKAFIF